MEVNLKLMRSMVNSCLTKTILSPSSNTKIILVSLCTRDIRRSISGMCNRSDYLIDYSVDYVIDYLIVMLIGQKKSLANRNRKCDSVNKISRSISKVKDLLSITVPHFSLVFQKMFT